MSKKKVFCVKAKRLDTDRKIGEELDRMCGLWRICHPNVSDAEEREHCLRIAGFFEILDV